MSQEKKHQKKVQSQQAPASQTEPVLKIKRNSFSDHIVRRSTRGYTLWRYSPAMVKLLRLPELSLVEVARARGMEVQHPYDIKWVRAAMLVDSTEVHIYPTHGKDPDRIDIVRNSSGTWINLITLLHDTGWLLPPGYRAKHTVWTVGEEGFDGPAIVFDLQKELVRKGGGDDDDDDKKKEAQTEGAEQQAPAQQSLPEAPSGEEKSEGEQAK